MYKIKKDFESDFFLKFKKYNTPNLVSKEKPNKDKEEKLWNRELKSRICIKTLGVLRF